MFDIILFFTSWKNKILPSRDEILRGGFISWYPKKNYQATEKKLLHQKTCTSFHDGGHIRLTWLLFEIILFSTRKRDGILLSRDKVPGDSRLSWSKTKTSNVLGKTLLNLRCCTSFHDGGHIRLTWLLFDIILLSSRERDGILISRDEVPRDSTLSWFKDKN